MARKLHAPSTAHTLLILHMKGVYLCRVRAWVNVCVGIGEDLLYKPKPYVRNSLHTRSLVPGQAPYNTVIIIL
jgi:hypothetical protein